MAIDPRNIVLEVNGCPFQLEFNPTRLKFRIIDNNNPFVNYKKITSFQHLCLMVELDLIWDKDAGFDENQFEVLKGIFKERTSFYIYPNPDAEPTLKFLVNWIDKHDFDPSSGWLDGFEWFGEIKLIGAESLEDTDFDEWEFYDYD